MAIEIAYEQDKDDKFMSLVETFSNSCSHVSNPCFHDNNVDTNLDNMGTGTYNNISFISHFSYYI